MRQPWRLFVRCLVLTVDVLDAGMEVLWTVGVKVVWTGWNGGEAPRGLGRDHMPGQSGRGRPLCGRAGPQ